MGPGRVAVLQRSSPGLLSMASSPVSRPVDPGALITSSHFLCAERAERKGRPTCVQCEQLSPQVITVQCNEYGDCSECSVISVLFIVYNGSRFVRIL